MEKIKITREQRDAFNSLGSGFMTKEQKFLNFITCTPFEGVLKPLNEFTPNEFALLILGWYEVEQPVEFEVGDWVFDRFVGLYRKLIDGASQLTIRECPVAAANSLSNPDDFEKVTEQWKIILLELGREKPEFQAGDVIETEEDCYCFDENNDEEFTQEVIMLFEKDLVRAFHAAEHRIEVKGNES